MKFYTGLLFCYCCWLIVVASDEGHFLWWSDLHYDPFYGTGIAYNPSKCGNLSSEDVMGKVGCDSPWILLESAFAYSSSVLPNPEFLLITGDFMRHGMDLIPAPFDTLESSTSKILLRLRERFPDTEIIFSIGNNDVIPDYHLDVTKNSTVLTSLEEVLVYVNILSEEERENFRSGGFYSRTCGNIVIASINTVVYSIQHTPYQIYIVDPFQQWYWLEGVLEKAKTNKKNVYIVGHIAPTIGSYRHHQLWHSQYIEIYYGLVKKYSDVIAGQLFGHLHSEEFRTIGESSALLIASSVTPIYESNPSFLIVSFDKQTGLLLNYDTFSLYLVQEDDPQPTWNHLYSFTEIYEVPDLSFNSLEAIVHAIDIGQGDLGKFLKYLKADVPFSQCDIICQKQWVCTFQSPTKSFFSNCMIGTEHNRFHRMNTKGIIVVLFGGSIVFFLALRSYIKRRIYRNLRYEQKVDQHNIDEDFD